MVKSFEIWRPKLVNTAKPVKVYTDHRNLEYFMTTKQLNRQQARWAKFLSEFNFKIIYRSRKQSKKPNIPTQQFQNISKRVKDARQ